MVLSLPTIAGDLTMSDSPAVIVRQLLADSLSSYTPQFACFATNEPSSPDRVVTVYDTIESYAGRDQVSGAINTFYGIQVRIRSDDHSSGYAAAYYIKMLLAEEYISVPVIISNRTYLVYSFSQPKLLVIGKDVPHSKRTLFTINALASIRRIQ